MMQLEALLDPFLQILGECFSLPFGLLDGDTYRQANGSI